MENLLKISHIVVALLMVIAILLQEKGAGFGAAIGGTGGGQSSFQTTKRGAEKVLSRVTLILIVVFLGLSLVLNLI